MLEIPKLPFVTLSQIQKIAEKYPTPFHLYNEEGIRETARAVNRAFYWNPGFREFFAVKACPNPAILRILQGYGCGCDCSSLSELLLAYACGFSGNSIMFSSNDTPDEEFILAHKLNAIINLDDISHIDQLERIFDADDFPEVMSCRYNPGGDFSLNNEIMGEPGEAKYGMTKEQIFEAFARLQRLGVKKFGLHAFLASNVLDEDYYAGNARVLFDLAVELHQEHGYDIDFINLSGGVGIPYFPNQKPNNIIVIGNKVMQTFMEVMARNGLEHTKIFTEMGRFMTGPHGCLVTKAIHYKDTYKHYIGVDACAADLMRPAMYGTYHHITVLGKEREPHDHIYDIVGSLCENNDKFAVNRHLPRIDMGDYLVIHDTGAHGRAMGYNYNGKLRCGEILLEGGDTFKLIRRRETISDLFATFTGLSQDIDFLYSSEWAKKNPNLTGFLS